MGSSPAERTEKDLTDAGQRGPGELVGSLSGGPQIDTGTMDPVAAATAALFLTSVVPALLAWSAVRQRGAADFPGTHASIGSTPWKSWPSPQ